MDIVDEWDSGVPNANAHAGEADALGSEWTVVDTNSPDTTPPIFTVELIEHSITR